MTPAPRTMTQNTALFSIGSHCPTRPTRGWAAFPPTRAGWKNDPTLLSVHCPNTPPNPVVWPPVRQFSPQHHRYTTARQSTTYIITATASSTGTGVHISPRLYGVVAWASTWFLRHQALQREASSLNLAETLRNRGGARTTSSEVAEEAPK